MLGVRILVQLFVRRVSQSGRSIARGCRPGLFLPGAAGSRPFALTPGGAS